MNSLVDDDNMLIIEPFKDSSIIRVHGMDFAYLLDFWARAKVWLAERYGVGEYKLSSYHDKDICFSDMIEVPDACRIRTSEGYDHSVYRMCYMSFMLESREYPYVDDRIAIQVPDEYVALEMRIAT